MTTKQNKKSTEDVPGGTDFDISVFCSVFVYISVLSTFQMVMSCVHGCPRSFSSRYPCLTVTLRRSPSLLQYHAHSNGLPNACTSRVDPLATNTAVFHSLRSTTLNQKICFTSMRSHETFELYTTFPVHRKPASSLSSVFHLCCVHFNLLSYSCHCLYCQA